MSISFLVNHLTNLSSSFKSRNSLVYLTFSLHPHVIYLRDLQVLYTVDVVDIYMDKIGAIAGISPCPAGVVVPADVVDSFI